MRYSVMDSDEGHTEIHPLPQTSDIAQLVIYLPMKVGQLVQFLAGQLVRFLAVPSYSYDLMKKHVKSLKNVYSDLELTFLATGLTELNISTQNYE